MSREKDSELVNIIRGGGGSLWPSRAERRLLKFALETFGEHLSQFLLSGLGEEGGRRIWVFNVTFTNEKNVVWRHELCVETDELPDVSTFLPCQRDPLVVLSLLRLLLGRTPFSTKVFYEQDEVLNILGWDDTSDSRLAIDEALERYANLSYRWSLLDGEPGEPDRHHVRGRARFISGYSHDEAAEAEGGQMRRESNRIDFAFEFEGVRLIV